MSNLESVTVKPELSFFENEQNHTIFNSSEESILDNRVGDIENYLKQNYGQKKTESEKDELYKESQRLWHLYVSSLRDVKYNFFLNRAQHKFLTDLILTKLEYDVNTVFFAIELTNLLGGMKDLKFSTDQDLISIPVNATEITYIYHLISKHKVKGLTKDAYTFSKILLRIGSISKVFNYYENISKTLSKEIQDWIVTFDEGVSLDENASASFLEPQV
jgi:hypothetical protein